MASSMELRWGGSVWSTKWWLAMLAVWPWPARPPTPAGGARGRWGARLASAKRSAGRYTNVAPLAQLPNNRSATAWRNGSGQPSQRDTGGSEPARRLRLVGPLP